MRPITLGFRFYGEDFETWAERALHEIENASIEDATVIADTYTVSNFTASRTLNAGTATATQVANVLATFIDDLQKRSPNRVE
jgi:hypothetical protein